MATSHSTVNRSRKPMSRAARGEVLGALAGLVVNENELTAMDFILRAFWVLKGISCVSS